MTVDGGDVNFVLGFVVAPPPTHVAGECMALLQVSIPPSLRPEPE